MLVKDPRARELLKKMKEPADAEEAAEQYVIIAEKLGVSLPKDQMLSLLKEKERFQQELTAQTEAQVSKEVLPEEALDHVAGGKDHNECSSTFTDDENCWFSDRCNIIISSYDKPSGMGGPASNGYACDVATRVLTADDECKEGMADWLGSGAIICPVEYEQ